MKNEIADRLEKLGIIPVIVIEDAKSAVPLAQALIKGGLPCAEITFRTAAAADAIKTLTQEFPDLLVGAGTVLKEEQADAARRAGAKFIVAPGFNQHVVGYCQEHDVEIYPGVCTPTDIEAALGMGLTVLKFFPAEPMGGLNYLKAISAPYGQLRFIPTGGVNPQNVGKYLAFNKILACAGTWLASKDAIAGERFDEIEANVREAVRLVKEARGV